MKNIFITLIIFFSAPSTFADWSVVAGTGSYMGEQHLGFSYESQNEKHQTDLSYGKTPGVLGNDIDQINLKYLFSPLNYQRGPLKTNILGIGMILSRWQSSAGFIESPSQYPETHYYSVTRYRSALLLSHTWSYKGLTLYVDWALLDQVAIALANNQELQQEKSAWSSGFGLRWSL